MDYRPTQYDFDDVLIKPIPSHVNFREEVDISVNLSDRVNIPFPVIASPMFGIVDAKFALEFAKFGGMTIMHRFYADLDTWKKEIKDVSTVKNWGASIGLKDSNLYWIMDFQPTVILIDVANGYLSSLVQYCSYVKNYIDKNNYNTLLMCGNVATLDGCKALSNSGADIIRVGIGSGALCSTRNVTGIGVPQISAIQDCSSQISAKIVADGGIRNSGDMVKAFVAGADAIMVGSMFAQTYESPSNNTIFGMASRTLQEMRYTSVKSVEGIEKPIQKTKSLEQLVDEISWGIRSAATYLNARNIEEIFSNGEFILAGKNSIKEL